MRHRQQWLRSWMGRCLLGAVFVFIATTRLAAEEPAADAEKLDPEHAAKMARGLVIFHEQVRAILVNRCAKCHGGESTEGQFDISGRKQLLKGGESGPAIKPGVPAESLLYKLVTHQAEPHMPHEADKLPETEIAHLAAWIENLAPYDGSLVDEGDKGDAWTERKVPAAARDFWSFRPLALAEPPQVKRGDWCRTPLDRFVLNKLESAEIVPSPEAARRSLIRRAWFDLVGLPPPPEAVQAFENDPSPAAFERVIDGLLESSAYGERWARHWLDLARFAESHGYEHDYDRPTAYHFRDFVIQALNQDMPYDQFVKWQLAGDEYAPDNPLAMMATGYLAAGVHSTQITANEAERHRYDELDDIVANIGTSMLGLTLGCARCHDHKFDPLPMADYYRMVSAFTTTVRSEVELNFDPEGYQAALAKYQAEHAPFEAAIKKFEEEQLPRRLAAWEAERSTSVTAAPWLVLQPSEAKSSGGATLAPQPDGSLRAEGPRPEFDSYTLTVKTGAGPITGLRIEALGDASMVRGGPGRADNGNFALSDFIVEAAPAAEPEKKSRIALKDPRATFEQSGLPIAATIDGDAKSAWAVDPQFGKDHAAAFTLASPLPAGERILTFTFKFDCNNKHSIGRLRVSLTNADTPPELTAPALPAKIPEILARPRAERSADEAAILLSWYRSQDDEWRKLRQAADEHMTKQPQPSLHKVLVSSEGLPPLRLHSQGADFLPETHFLRRGDPNQKVKAASSGYLQVLLPLDGELPRHRPSPPSGARTSFRRTALAEWLCDTEAGAGALLARVIVNRLWQHHWGRGIVATPSDFGTRGEAPVDPELLDYLAGELIKNGWRLKPIHKLIMTSAVYQQAATADAGRLARDPDEKFHWRWHSRRLEAEVIRDAMLALSGTLDPTMYGPGTLDENSRRRSVYFTVKRSKLLPMMQVFDAPDALSGLAERPTTTVAPQALMLMNNPQVRGYARSLATRIASGAATEEIVRRAYLAALARAPTSEELGDGMSFIDQQAASYAAAGQGEARLLAATDFCQVLFCLNEFVYLD